ncbi:MAG TPA: hypothetical protein VF791_11660 [Pyrinomonadaceae bacterium]
MLERAPAMPDIPSHSASSETTTRSLDLRSAACLINGLLITSRPTVSSRSVA